MLEVAYPQWRDPEYGLRRECLQTRCEENPGRPVAVVLGSSRVTFGVRPLVWEETRRVSSQTLLFNMGRIGGGPLLQYMTLLRLYADGVKPDLVVIEYWPPFLSEQGAFNELAHIDTLKLYLADRPFLRKFHPCVQDIEATMWEHRTNPLFIHRQRWLAALAPSWVPRAKRNEPGCRGMDDWGWVPGLDYEPTKQAARLAHYHPIFREHLGNLCISENADHALREMVKLARAHGSRVVLAYLPESHAFRCWYPDRIEATIRKHREHLERDLMVTFLDGREWLGEDCFADGFHLSPEGAALFTQRLGLHLSKPCWPCDDEKAVNRRMIEMLCCSPP